MTRFYVAASSRDLPRARRVMRALEAAGLENACDWTLDMDEAARRGWKTDREVPDDFAILCAERDLEAVRTSDIFILLVNEGGTGQWIEFGFALAMRQYRAVAGPWILVSGDPKRTIFLRRGPTDEGRIEPPTTSHTLTDGWFPTDEALVEHVLSL